MKQITKNTVLKQGDKMPNKEKSSLFWILFIGIGGFILLYLTS